MGEEDEQLPWPFTMLGAYHLMRDCRLPLVGAILAIVLALPLSAADLLEVYRTAQDEDAVLAAAEAQYLAALEIKPQARAALLPQARAGGGFGWSKSYSESYFVPDSDAFGTDDPIRNVNAGSARNWDVSLSVDQVLFNKAFWERLQQADVSIAQARAELEVERQALILRVAEAYFAVLSAQDSLRFAQKEKEAIGRQLEQAEKRFEVGLIAVTDVKEAQADYDRAVAQEIAARNELDTAMEALAVLTGQPFTTFAILSEDFPLSRPEPADIDAWRDTATENNLQLRAAQLGLEVAGREIRRQRGGYFPTLNAQAAHSFQRVNDPDFELDSSRRNSSIGLQLIVPLFQGGGVSANVRQAQANFTRAQEQLLQTQREAVREARSGYLSVISGISQVEALRQAEDSAKTALEATEAGFEVGTRTAVDVLLAVRSVYAASRDLAQARYAVILYTLRLKQAAGTLVDRDLAQINQYLD